MIDLEAFGRVLTDMVEASVRRHRGLAPGQVSVKARIVLELAKRATPDGAAMALAHTAHAAGITGDALHIVAAEYLKALSGQPLDAEARAAYPASPRAEPPFKVGDQVVLKGDRGPVMTVKEVARGEDEYWVTTTDLEVRRADLLVLDAGGP